MNRIDLSNLRLLSKGEGLRVYELVDDYVNFVDAEVSCGYPRSGGCSMELVKMLELHIGTFTPAKERHQTAE